MALPEPIGQPMMSYMQPGMQGGMQPPMMSGFGAGRPPMGQPPFGNKMWEGPFDPQMLDFMQYGGRKPADPHMLWVLDQAMNEQENIEGNQLLRWQDSVRKDPWTWRGKITPAIPGG
tara:strand:+ start:3463 stop:3813 length:351 start_codon:yes stop_codon:yes gene_type:complete